LLRYFRKHHMQPPPCALNALPEQGGLRQRWGWCARTMGAAAPWASPMATVLLWWAAGWARMPPPRCFGLVVTYGWACLLFCLNTSLGKCILMYSCVCAYKTYKYQNLWRMLVIKPVSKFWWSYFLYFVEMLAV
jgi:hypothetical protein